MYRYLQIAKPISMYRCIRIYEFMVDKPEPGDPLPPPKKR